MKKEIRLYFNIEKEKDKIVYNHLHNKRSTSNYIIDLINEQLTNTSTNIIASKLDAIVDALYNITITTSSPTTSDPVDASNELSLDLTDNFDDNY